MKVPYNEEIANHIGPESCGCRGNTVASGEDVDRGKHRQWSRQLSSENTTNWVPTLWPEGEGNIFHSVMASYGKTWRSLRTWHVWIPHERESGEPGKNFDCPQNATKTPKRPQPEMCQLTKSKSSFIIVKVRRYECRK